MAELMLRHTSVLAIKFDPSLGKLQVLNQLLLPHKVEYVDIKDHYTAIQVIKTMLVRGAPCIAAVGFLSLVVELNRRNVNDWDSEIDWLTSSANQLIASRPTAVNLKNALKHITNLEELYFKTNVKTPLNLRQCLLALASSAYFGGQDMNVQLGEHGATKILAQEGARQGDRIAVLTHCNTGSLATVGYGTALGVIRSLHSRGRLLTAYCTETRPYNQGSRLSVWELMQDKVPATLIADNMAAHLMEQKSISAVVVGADCVTKVGDTANKIGTMQLAIVANYFKVPFYVAAPLQSCDMSKTSGREIEIEHRPADEMRKIAGVQIAPSSVDVWNPCFDVTPARLITGIITECGVCRPDELYEFYSQKVNSPEYNKLSIF